MRSHHTLCSIIIAVLFINCQGQPQRMFVASNLLSYNGDDAKKTLLVNADVTKFEILDPVTSELVYEGSLTTAMSSDTSIGARASLNNLSEFGNKGYFKIELENEQGITSRKNTSRRNLNKSTVPLGNEEEVPGVGKSNKNQSLSGSELSKFPGENYGDSENTYFLSERSNNTAGNYDNH